MKKSFKIVSTALISFIICLALFLSVVFLTLMPLESKEIAVTKPQQKVNYFIGNKKISTTILINIENCPTHFFVKLSSESQKVTIYCEPKNCISQTGTFLEGFRKDECQKHISFTAFQLDDVINFLGGVELETPYGLPSPANTNTLIAKDERTVVYGASLRAILCKEKEPSATQMNYYGYLLSEVCLKFLKNCDTNYYKFLKNNSETDISYADFYDNFKTLKESIKYADYLSSKGFWQKGVFYLE